MEGKQQTRENIFHSCFSDKRTRHGLQYTRLWNLRKTNLTALALRALKLSSNFFFHWTFNVTVRSRLEARPFSPLFQGESSIHKALFIGMSLGVNGAEKSQSFKIILNFWKTERNQEWLICFALMFAWYSSCIKHKSTSYAKLSTLDVTKIYI